MQLLYLYLYTFIYMYVYIYKNGVLISPTRKEVSSEACQATRAISTTSRRELASGFFPLQSKAHKEIHAILTEILACLLPGLAKELSALHYFTFAVRM